MTRAAIRVVLCGAFVCLTAAVTLAQTTTHGDQEVPGHRGGREPARRQACPKARGN